MNELARKIIDAHGGLTRWKQYRQLRARLKQGGALWTLKGHAGLLDETAVTVGLGEEWASHQPFGDSATYTRFEPSRVEIRGSGDTLLEELENPRDSFVGHKLETPWSRSQLAYFAGCAMWTYLNMPFLLAEPDVQVEDLPNWEERGESWHRLRITFPKRIATHSTVQTIYVDDAGFLKRHDYDVEIAGNTPGAHYIGKYVEVQGLMFPTERRIFPRGVDGQSMSEPLVVSIDLSEIELA